VFEEVYDVDTPAAAMLITSWPDDGILVNEQIIFQDSVKAVVLYKRLNQNIMDVMLRDLQKQSKIFNEKYGQRNNFVSYLFAYLSCFHQVDCIRSQPRSRSWLTAPVDFAGNRK
jgi:hypothetical protein